MQNKQVISHIGRQRLHTKNECMISAKRFKTKKTWQEKEPRMVSAARRHHWYLECTAHMQQMPHGTPKKWTKEKCATSALNHTNVSEWKNSNYGAYQAAKRYGWLTEITKHFIPLGSLFNRYVYIIRIRNSDLVYVGLTRDLKKRMTEHLTSPRFKKIQAIYGKQCLRVFCSPRLFQASEAAIIEENLIIEFKTRGFTTLNKKRGGGLGASSSKWTFQAVEQDAKNYDFIGTWSIKSHAAYTTALNNNWIKKLIFNGTISRKVKQNGYWTKQRIKNSALKYATKKSWFDNEPKAYSAATRAGLLDNPEITSHFVPTLKWTEERLIIEVAKYKTLKSFRIGSPSAYSTIKKLKQLKKYTSALKRKNKSWTKENILKSAEKFSTKNNFHRYGQGAYQAAKRNGIFELATKNMH